MTLPMRPGRSPRAWQSASADAARYCLIDPAGPQWQAGLIVAATGCHAPGQRVLRVDGRPVVVEDVRVGDQILGPDSTPRTVLSLARGRDEMYRIVPIKGDPWVVNGDHVLTLSWRPAAAHGLADVLEDMTVREWMALPPGVRGSFDLARTEAAPADRRRSAFAVEPVGVGDYFGFHLDGDHRYLLDDFTITHNSGKGDVLSGLAVSHALRGGRAVIVVDRENLVTDLYDRCCQVAVAHGLLAKDLQGRPTRHAAVGMCMAGRKETGHPVVVASIQTISQPEVLARLKGTSLLITDEAHGAVAPSHRALHARLDTLYPKWKHIGMTATGFRGDGSEGLGDVFDGEIFHYSIADAIEAGDLVPIEDWAIPTSVNLGEVTVGADGEYDDDALADIINTPTRNRLAWQAYLDHAPGQPALFFAANVEHAHALATMGREEFGVRAEAVHGPNKKRPLSKADCAARIREFKESPETLPVLCSCDLIRVGFDAPRTRAVILCRPWKSLVAFVQTVGRGTRVYGIPDGLSTPEEKRAAIARSVKPNMIFIQLADVGCELTLTRATNLDSSEPTDREGRPLDVDDRCCRRRHPEWAVGRIIAVVEEEGRAGRVVTVTWPSTEAHPHGLTRNHPVRELARPPKDKKIEEPKPEPAEVEVTGGTPYRLHMVPGERATDPGAIAWYEYQGTYTVGAFAPRIGQIKMHIRPGEKGWDVWSIRPPLASRNEPPDEDIATRQREACENAAVAMAEANSHLRSHGAQAGGVAKAGPSSKGQQGFLRALGVRRDLDGVTFAEASALIDAASAKRRVDETLDPGLRGRREHVQAAWKRRRAAA